MLACLYQKEVRHGAKHAQESRRRLMRSIPANRLTLTMCRLIRPRTLNKPIFCLDYGERLNEPLTFYAEAWMSGATLAILIALGIKSQLISMR